MEFANGQGWALEEGRIYFPGPDREKELAAESGDQKDVIRNLVGYARELEMIV